MGGGEKTEPRLDYARVGAGKDELRLSFSSIYNAPSGKKTIYAIRFSKRDNAEPIVSKFGYDPLLGQHSEEYYLPATSNLLRCAYRYTYNETNKRLTIDVVYLGDSSDNIDKISNDSWWRDKQLISRTFPTAGYYNPNLNSLREVGNYGTYWSTSVAGESSNNWPYRTHYNYAGLAGSNYAYSPDYGLPVRLFKTIP